MKAAYLFSSLCFLVSRYLLLFEFRMGHYTDLRFYYSSARKMLSENFRTYCDFTFPYPPLSLPFVGLPALIKDSYQGYLEIYRLQMFFLDVIIFIFLLMFLVNRLKVKPKILCLSILGYSIASLYVGHLIYERLDTIMSLIFLSMIYFYTGSKKQRYIAYFIALAGSLVKLVPLFLVPILLLSEFMRDNESKEEENRNLLIPIGIIYGGFLVSMVAYEFFSCGGLFDSLSGHGKRGIHVESVWASPLLFLKSCCLSDALQIETNYGAFHIKGGLVTAPYLFLSKYLGFVLLGIFYIFLGLSLMRHKIVWRYTDSQFIALLVYTTLFLIVSTQRVFSPQFMVWMVPGVAILIAMSRKPLIVMLVLLAIFGLTYMEFDKGMWKIVYFNEKYINYLILRNVTIVLWTVYLIRRCFHYIKNYYTLNLRPL